MRLRLCGEKAGLSMSSWCSSGRIVIVLSKPQRLTQRDMAAFALLLVEGCISWIPQQPVISVMGARQAIDPADPADVCLSPHSTQPPTPSNNGLDHSAQSAAPSCLDPLTHYGFLRSPFGSMCRPIRRSLATLRSCPNLAVDGF